MSLLSQYFATTITKEAKYFLPDKFFIAVVFLFYENLLVSLQTRVLLYVPLFVSGVCRH